MFYKTLSDELTKRIEDDRRNGFPNPFRFDDCKAVRRDNSRDRATLVRPVFVRDSEKILHLPFYSRYADKTQVFSFYRNDDISRRALHVQLVSRIARNIGSLLGLNNDLIEAIALGHDMGHTPFGHAGERYLSELLHKDTGLYFNHNVHSVRVFDRMFGRNMTLQTLDGILCHNGEFEKKEFVPTGIDNFDEFDVNMERCYKEGGEFINTLVPATLEGCVVRISDMIAYLGKDRQDAVVARIIENDSEGFSDGTIGSRNAEIINNLIVDIVENSYGKPVIEMSDEGFEGLRTAKNENYRIIYKNPKVSSALDEKVKPMFSMLYRKLLDDYVSGDTSSPIFRHHISVIDSYPAGKGRAEEYMKELPEMIVADYIASMTDDYFIDLFACMFPDSGYTVEYRSYFE